MATQVQNRRGTTAEHSTFTGAVGELTVDTTKDTVVVHDGAVAGGRPLLREDQSNLPTSAPTTGIYSASGSLAISTSSSERIRIGVSGQIGLGGANYGTSGQVLTSAGSGAAPTWQTPAAGNTDKIEEGNSSAEVIDTGTDGRFVVTTEGSERLRVDSSGRVGIGTSTPGSYAQLAIFGTANVATYGNVSAIFSDGTTGSARFHHSSGNVKLSSDSALAIGTGVSATEVARFDTSGRLLVGTSTSRDVASGGPSIVQIEGSSFRHLSMVQNSNDDNGVTLAFGKSRGTSAGGTTIVQNNDDIANIRFAGANGSDVTTVAAQIRVQVDGTPGTTNDMPGRITFWTTADGAGSPTERLRITSLGTVGINRSNPGAYRLAVEGPAGYGGADIACSDTDRTPIVCANLATSGNNFLIGFFTDGYTQRGSIDYNRTGGAVRYNTTSDARLKSNIVDANSAVNLLSAINVRSFIWTETGYKVDYGFVAQELHQAVPDAVKVGDSGDVVQDAWAVDYSKVVPVLTKALQEAMERIETLEAKVAALEGA